MKPIIGLILVTATVWSFNSPIVDAASRSDINQKESEIQKIEEQLRAIENRKAQTAQEKEVKEEEAERLRGQISTLTSEIKDLEGKLTEVLGQISEKDHVINQTSHTITELESTLNQHKQSMSSLIAELYKQSVFKNEIITAMGSETISEAFAKVEYSNEMQNQIQKNLTTIIANKTLLDQEREKLNLEKASLTSVQTDLESKKSEVETAKNQTSSRIYASEIAASQLSANLKSLSSQEKDLERKRHQSLVELSRLEAELSSRYGGGTVCSGRGYLWPTQGRLTQGYGWTSFAQSGAYSGYMHNGIDIANSTGTPIRATAAGRVVSVGFNTLSYGKWVVIEHDDGYYSLYGHMSSQGVSRGERVSQGQYIGAMGSTGFSTGPHLHFTIYRPGSLRIGSSPQGASVNPSTCGY